MKKNIFFTIFLVNIFFNCYSQLFEWEAQVNEVDSSNYYDIFIRPEITSKLNYKFSDIRIFDENDAEIPFLRRSEINKDKSSFLEKFQIIENQHKISKKYTSVIISNSQKKVIDNMLMVLENTKSEVWLNISGSDDNKNWEILKNNKRYQPEFSDSLLAKVEITDIPSSKYLYYKILIYDFNAEVINLVQIYNYKIIEFDRKFTEVAKPLFAQDDTSEVGRTIVNISFPEEQYIDKIFFEINKPKYFLRKAEIAKKDSSTGKKIKLAYYDESQKDFNLCSDSINVLHLSKYKAKELFLVIDNNDDTPLQISDITAYQENEYFVAFLEKGKKYTIRFGNKNIATPIYDIKFFQNKIPDKVQIVEIKELNQLYNPDKDNINQMKIEPELLWLSFGIVILILGLISLKVFKSSLIHKKEGSISEEIED